MMLGLELEKNRVDFFANNLNLSLVVDQMLNRSAYREA